VLKNLCRLDLGLCVFCFLPFEKKSYVEMYDLELRSSKLVNFTILRNMIFNVTAPVNVHNPKKIKSKLGDVLSEPVKMSTRLFLRTADL